MDNEISKINQAAYKGGSKDSLKIVSVLIFLALIFILAFLYIKPASQASGSTTISSPQYNHTNTNSGFTFSNSTPNVYTLRSSYANNSYLKYTEQQPVVVSPPVYNGPGVLATYHSGIYNATYYSDGVKSGAPDNMPVFVSAWMEPCNSSAAAMLLYNSVYSQEISNKTNVTQALPSIGDASSFYGIALSPFSLVSKNQTVRKSAQTSSKLFILTFVYKNTFVRMAGWESANSTSPTAFFSIARTYVNTLQNQQ